MRLLAALLLTSLFIVGTSQAQNCPTPHLGTLPDTALYVTLSGVPFESSETGIRMYGSDNDSINYFTTPNLAVYTNTQVTVKTNLNTPSITGQIYALDLGFTDSTQAVRISTHYVFNRKKTTTGTDRVAIAQFGATAQADNYLMTFDLSEGAGGHLVLPVNVGCESSSTIQDFNARFLADAVGLPQIAYQVDAQKLGAYLFHQSLYSIDYAPVLTQLQSQISTLNGQTSSINGTISALTTTVNNNNSSLTTSVQALQSSTASQTTSLDSLTSQVGTLNQQSTQQANQIGSLDTKVTTVKQATDSLTSNVGTLSTDSSNLLGIISTLTSQLNTASKDLKAAQTRISKSENRIKKLEKALKARR